MAQKSLFLKVNSRTISRHFNNSSPYDQHNNLNRYSTLMYLFRFDQEWIYPAWCCPPLSWSRGPSSTRYQTTITMLTSYPRYGNSNVHMISLKYSLNSFRISHKLHMFKLSSNTSAKYLKKQIL